MKADSTQSPVLTNRRLALGLLGLLQFYEVQASHCRALVEVYFLYFQCYRLG